MRVVPKRTRKQQAPLPVIGWREWVSLPNLGVQFVKAKIDTGARTSAIHAYDIKPFEKEGQPWIHFVLHPMQRETRTTVATQAPVLDRRRIKSSSGHTTWRYTVETELRVGEHSWPIELTLASRDEMGFRMLIGRAALRHRVVVDPAKSYCLGPRVQPGRSGVPK